MASKIVSDLNKGDNGVDAPRFRAIAFTDSIPAMLAWANDSSNDDGFVERLQTLLEKGDGVIGISGSGTNENLRKWKAYAHAPCLAP